MQLKIRVNDHLMSNVNGTFFHSCSFSLTLISFPCFLLPLCFILIHSAPAHRRKGKREGKGEGREMK